MKGAAFKMKNRQKVKSIVALIIAVCMLLLIIAGSISIIINKDKNLSLSRKTVSILLPAFSDSPMRYDSPAKEALQDYTDTNIEITWAPAAYYEDSLNVAMASAHPPMIAYGFKSAGIMAKMKAGEVWEIGPYLQKYPNLSNTRFDILYNTSLNGNIFSLYRSRPLGQYGLCYRKDWLDSLGMDTPETIDDFYEMLYKFTYNDPDNNQKDDTYGMTLVNDNTSFNIIASWFGTPNEWGIADDGSLIPAFLTSEYFDTVKFFKRLYDNKLINLDFAITDTKLWNNDMANGVSGCIADTVSRGETIQSLITEKYGTQDNIGVLGALQGPAGKRLPSTDGYSGIFIFPKSGCKTEADLTTALEFMDKICLSPAQNIILYGVEGMHYTLSEEGYVQKNTLFLADINDFDQLYTGIPFNSALKTKPTPLSLETERIESDNELYLVSNYGAPFYSDTYGKQSVQMNSIIEDAKIKYFLGQIDDTGFKLALEDWKNSGGNEYIEEINYEYKKFRNK